MSARSEIRPRGLMFHHFWNADHPRGQGAITAAQLNAAIDALGIANILPPDEWRARVKANTLTPESTCLTFDDGLRCQYDIAEPVLRSRGLRAFWFVYSGPLTGEPDRLELYRLFRTIAFANVDAFYDAFFAIADEAMDAEERRRGSDRAIVSGHLPAYGFYSYEDRRLRYIRDVVLGPARYFVLMDTMMKRQNFDIAGATRRLWVDASMVRTLADAGHEIGLHSHTHPTLLAAMPVEAQRREFARNLEIVAPICGRRTFAAAYPCGSYTRETMAILSDFGVEIAFRANLAQGFGSPMEIPREDHTDFLRDRRL